MHRVKVGAGQTLYSVTQGASVFLFDLLHSRQRGHRAWP